MNLMNERGHMTTNFPRIHNARERPQTIAKDVKKQLSTSCITHMSANRVFQY